MLIGQLNSIKKISFPVFAAIGGMLIPIILFFILNKNTETTNGWGVPMATDIAFALAILRLLGNRVPLGLKVFLTAFATIDDIGAVLVIAIFYSSNVSWILLVYAGILLFILFILSYKNIYIKYLTLLFGIIIWFVFLKAGIHPTIAGVLLAFTIPVRQKISTSKYLIKISNIVSNIKENANNKKSILSKKQIANIDNLEDWTSRVQSPLQHLEHRLHNWVAYFIMPLFALSNAGVIFSSDMNLDYYLITVIAVSLFFGNLIGVTLMSFIGIKLKLTKLPQNVNFWQIIGIASLGGVGFTMSIFIANLAFVDNPSFIDSAKVGILVGSLIAGLVGYLILRLNNKTIKQ